MMLRTPELILKAYEYNPLLLICGDFNYREINWSTDHAPTQYQNDFIETLHDCQLHQSVTEPTRYRENQELSLLDLVISYDETIVRDLEYHPPLGESDHLCLTFTAFSKTTTSYFRPVPDVRKTDYQKVMIGIIY